MTVISPEMLRTISPRADAVIIKDIAGPLNQFLPVYGINTEKRIEHFLAQCAHESAGFRTMHEYASGAAYEGRLDLGNTQPGDGRRFKGRGLIQLTGRANYKTFGDRIGVDLVGSPESAASPVNAVRLACEYWKDRKLNALADRDDIRGITKKINGGYNGLADRQAYLARARKLITGPLAEPPSIAPPSKTPQATTGAVIATGGTIVAATSGLGWLEIAGIAFASAVFGYVAYRVINKLRGNE